MSESRTKKSLKNSLVALMMYLVNLVLQFISRKIFLDYLGTEILGLNTTVNNILQFLNLAELGIGVAVSFSLYLPLAKNDYEKIKDICIVQGILYRKIGFLIIISSLILMCFFPLIFKKMSLPLWYAYASFLVLLFSSLLSYFINYKQIVLSANQQNYKIIYSSKAIMALKVVFQVIFIRYFPDGYIWWLIWEVIFAIISCYCLNKTIYKEFPYLKNLNLHSKELLDKYPEIVKKTKEVFVHKISGFALTQISPIIIYGIISMTMVAIYGNYMLIVTGIYSLLNAIFNGMTASVGNLISGNDTLKSLRVFRELFSSRFLISTTICSVLVVFANPFISLWIGSEYLLGESSIFLIIGILFINTTRSVVDSYIYAYGLFHDIWAAILETILNIGLSIIWGFQFGLNGILSGVITSLFIIYVIWKPFFLFKSALKINYFIYLKLYSKHIIISVCLILTNYLMCKLYLSDIHFSWLKLISFTLIDATIIFSIAGCILYLTDSGIRIFATRCYDLIFLRRN
ncbi:MAG: sugar transporter [Bacteroides sp.]|nr:sugar transporter [Bacteroides sp.]